MFRATVVGAITILVFGIGCDAGRLMDEILWGDGSTRSSTLSVGGLDDGPSQTIRSLGTSDRVYFRSSDIEFWHIESVSDLGSLMSTKYATFEGPDYGSNHSLEYRLGDSTESVVFSPETDMTVAVDRADLNPTWNEKVAAFVAAGKSKISAMRLDIGAGNVTFVIDGGERHVYAADGGEGNGIDGNSIFFVDRQFLRNPLLVTRDIEASINDGTATAQSLGLSDAEFALVQTIHTSSNTVDVTTPIDVNGALIIPMDPVDISDFDPASETLDIVFWWKIAGAVHVRDGEYFMDGRVGPTCFDFDVTVKRTAK